MQIVIDTRFDTITPAFAEQVAVLLGHIAATDPQPPCLEALAEPVAEVVAPEPEAKAKPKKRKRRTKAQIAADKKAAEEAIIAKAAAEQDVTAEKVLDANPVEAPAPVETPPAPEPPPVVPSTVDVEAVKAAVISAIGRLNAVPQEPDPLGEAVSPTVQVVKVIEEVTGCKRVGEVPEDQYGALLAALNNVCV
jgi:hypothetical protein